MNRLKLYQQALRDYTERSSDIYSLLCGGYGFCSYFYRIHKIELIVGIYNHFASELPELWEQKPKYGWGGNSNYWFHPNNKDNRIECLKKAIELCK